MVSDVMLGISLVTIASMAAAFTNKTRVWRIMFSALAMLLGVALGVIEDTQGMAIVGLAVFALAGIKFVEESTQVIPGWSWKTQ